MKLANHYMKYLMDITILAMPTGLMLTCETSKTKVVVCNFDNLFFNQNDCCTPI